MPDVEIEEVRFSPPWLDEPDSERGERREWTDVTISIRNRSAQATYYVRADVQGIQYDESNATLKLLLAELPPNEALHVTFLRLPNLIPVLPGAAVVIRDTIPTRLKGLDLSSDGTLGVQTIDISRMKRVEVSVAHDMTPFRPVHTDHPREIRKQLHGWGTPLEYACACCLPAQGGSDETRAENV